MEKYRIWLSYDLGVNGDYSNLYAWLDDLHAKECGNSIATFIYECDSGMDLVNNIRKSMQGYNIDFGPQNRIYCVFKKDDNSYVGKFIIGRRKSSPWEGYGKKTEEQEDKES